MPIKGIRTAVKRTTIQYSVQDSKGVDQNLFVGNLPVAAEVHADYGKRQAEWKEPESPDSHHEDRIAFVMIIQSGKRNCHHKNEARKADHDRNISI